MQHPRSTGTDVLGEKGKERIAASKRRCLSTATEHPTATSACCSSGLVARFKGKVRSSYAYVRTLPSKCIGVEKEIELSYPHTEGRLAGAAKSFLGDIDR